MILGPTIVTRRVCHSLTPGVFADRNRVRLLPETVRRLQFPANSAARKAATLSQSFAAASKSTSIAWTVLGVSTRAAASVLLQQRDLGARAVGQRRLDLGAEQVRRPGPRPPSGAGRP